MDNFKQKPWYVLDINVDHAIQSNFDFDEFYKNSEFAKASQGWGLWHFIDNKTTVITQEWIDYMNSLDIEVGSIVLFYRAADYKHYVKMHVDSYNQIGKAEVESQFANYALNWVVKNEDCGDMVWYEWPTEPGVLDFYTKEFGGGPYYHWPDLGNGKELASRRIGKQLTLVNVGIPHDVVHKDHARWCISVRMRRRWPNSKITNWAEAVEYYQPFIKE